MTFEILNNREMAKADRLTKENGTDGFELMKAAGQHAARIIAEKYPENEFLVLCGPGNNGGDGLVAANHLKSAGKNVRIAALGNLDDYTGDAAKAAEKIDQHPDLLEDLSEEVLANPKLVIIDAVFGTGFDRKLQDPVSSVFKKINSLHKTVVAIDIPSGVNGNDGTLDSNSLQADLTITFFRKKLGHFLQPGRSTCGKVVVCDIGIPSEILEQTDYSAIENDCSLWFDFFPIPLQTQHKYDRGYAVVYGGDEMTGAARMSAEACLRVGAGLCCLLCSQGRGDLYRSIMPPPVIVHEDPGWDDDRVTARCVGPGAGEHVDKIVTKFLSSFVPIVLDGDALHSRKPYNDHVILTPHEGEFQRLFPETKGSKLERVLEVTQIMTAVMVLKGSDTIIAQQGRKPVINTNTSPYLSTAGSGDVLSGILTGLLAQGMSPFEASCAGVWMHGDASCRIGPGLLAHDLPAVLPEILSDLLGDRVM